MTYDPIDGGATEESLRAFARGLEHINLGWAFAGACMRLPGISHFIQILLDGSGLGPRRIPRRSTNAVITPSACTYNRSRKVSTGP
jgi:hypothetical protein